MITKKDNWVTHMSIEKSLNFAKRLRKTLTLCNLQLYWQRVAAFLNRFCLAVRKTVFWDTVYLNNSFIKNAFENWFNNN